MNVSTLGEQAFLQLSSQILNSIQNHEVLRQLLKSLTDLFRQDDMRKHYGHIHSALFSVLQQYQANEVSIEVQEVFSELFCTIRNAVAASPSNQNLCAESAGFCNTVWQVMYNNLRILTLEQPLQELQEKLVCTLRCGIQCLGNIVVQNPTSKRIVWSIITPAITDFLTFPDEKTTTYCSMLFYNCLYEMPETTVELLSNQQFTIHVVELMSSSANNEWNDYTLVHLLKFGGFVSLYYPQLSRISRECILSLLETEIKTVPYSHSESVQGLLKAIESVAEIYVQKCNLFYSSDLQSEENTCELLRLLDVLGTASSTGEYSKVLMDRQSIVVCSVILLKAVQDAGKQGNPLFEPVCRPLGKEDLHPAYGFKRDLVSLIGNLCYRNKKNQDEVREMGGINLLLDCTGKIDSRNKFMIEWVVLAIRNLCENNVENQNCIAALQNQGYDVGQEIVDQLEALQIKHG